jgi:hypothetical protein
MRIPFFVQRGLWLMACLLGMQLVIAADAPGDDAEAIRHTLMAQFDKPEARLQVEPVAVAGNAAVASWAQGERGGRALLFRRSGQWQIALCAGDGLKGTQLIREAGVSARDAEAIVRALASGEARLSPAQRAKFATFDGIVRMGAGGQHPPAHRQ